MRVTTSHVVCAPVMSQGVLPIMDKDPSRLPGGAPVPGVDVIPNPGGNTTILRRDTDSFPNPHAPAEEPSAGAAGKGDRLPVDEASPAEPVAPSEVDAPRPQKSRCYTPDGR